MLYCVKERVLTTCSQVVDHLLDTHATDDIMTGTESEIAPYVKLPYLSPLNFVMSFGWSQLDLHTFPHVYDDYVRNGSSSKNYSCLLDRVCDRTWAAVRVHRCRNWRIIPPLLQNCKPRHAQESIHSCILPTDTSQIVVSHIANKWYITAWDRQQIRSPNDHPWEKK